MRQVGSDEQQRLWVVNRRDRQVAEMLSSDGGYACHEQKGRPVAVCCSVNLFRQSHQLQMQDLPPSHLRALGCVCLSSHLTLKSLLIDPKLSLTLC